MTLTLNGQSIDAPDRVTTVADLLAHIGSADRPVAVEVNKELVPRRLHTDRTLNPGDTIEIVTLVGGG